MEINLVARSFIYFVVAVAVGSYYDNWTSMEKYLYESDIYAQECSSSEVLSPPSDVFRCKKQQTSLSALLSYSRASEFLSSIFVGLLMDFCGPKFSSSLGVILRMMSWLFLAYFPQSPAIVKASFSLSGISTNLVLFPAMTIGLYTTKYRSQVMVYIGMSSSISSFLIKLKEHLLFSGILTSKQISLIYSFCVLLPCILICLLVFPNKPPKAPKNDAVAESVEDKKWTVGEFMASMKTKEFVVCCIYYAFNISSITFVQQSFSVIYGDDPLAVNVNEYALPMSFIACLTFAFLYKWCSPISIIIFLNGVGAAMHIVALFRNTACGIALSVLLTIAYSILNTKIYNYLEQIFEKTYFGSIMGFMNTLGGVAVIINTYATAAGRTPSKVDTSQIAMLVIRLVFMIPFCYFAIPKSKLRKIFRATQKMEAGK